MSALDPGSHTEPTFRGYRVGSIAGEGDATMLETACDAYRLGQNAFDLHLFQVMCVKANSRLRLARQVPAPARLSRMTRCGESAQM